VLHCFQKKLHDSHIKGKEDEFEFPPKKTQFTENV